MKLKKIILLMLMAFVITSSAYATPVDCIDNTVPDIYYGAGVHEDIDTANTEIVFNDDDDTFTVNVTVNLTQAVIDIGSYQCVKVWMDLDGDGHLDDQEMILRQRTFDLAGTLTFSDTHDMSIITAPVGTEIGVRACLAWCHEPQLDNNSQWGSNGWYIGDVYGFCVVAPAQKCLEVEVRLFVLDLTAFDEEFMENDVQRQAKLEKNVKCMLDRANDIFCNAKTGIELVQDGDVQTIDPAAVWYDGKQLTDYMDSYGRISIVKIGNKHYLKKKDDENNTDWPWGALTERLQKTSENLHPDDPTCKKLRLTAIRLNENDAPYAGQTSGDPRFVDPDNGEFELVLGKDNEPVVDNSHHSWVNASSAAAGVSAAHELAHQLSLWHKGKDPCLMDGSGLDLTYTSMPTISDDEITNMRVYIKTGAHKHENINGTHQRLKICHITKDACDCGDNPWKTARAGLATATTPAEEAVILGILISFCPFL